MSHPDWRELVRRATAEIDAGRLDKVVLARSVRITTYRPLCPDRVARRLGAWHPETVVVLISIDEGPDLPAATELRHAVALVRKQDFGPRLLRQIWRDHGH